MLGWGKAVKTIISSLALIVWGLCGSLEIDSNAPVTSLPSARYPQWPWTTYGFAHMEPRFATIAFSQKTTRDNNIPKGQTLLITPGRDGLEFCVGKVRTLVSKPVEQVVALGTAPVHAIEIKGTHYTYDRVLTVLTTAYNAQYAMNGPSGAVAAWDGLPLHDGDVAVDPDIVPLGSYLYVDGYGPARAVDTGSAIIGDHIDLFFNESASLISRYGMQFHKVYVLTGRPSTYHG